MKKAVSGILSAFMLVSGFSAFAENNAFENDGNDFEIFSVEDYDFDALEEESHDIEAIDIDTEGSYTPGPGVSGAEVLDADAFATVSAPKITFESVLEGVQVTITCATAGAKIYYTTDGSAPSESSESSVLYDADNPPVLDKAGSYTIKAAAYYSGSGSSTVSGAKTVYSCGFDIDQSNLISKTPVYSTSTGETMYIKLSINGISSDYRVFYTTGDSIIPDTSSEEWSGYLSIYKPTRLNFKIYRAGYAPTEVRSVIVTDDSWNSIETVAKPEVKTVSYVGSKRVYFITETADADVRYIISDSPITDNLYMSNTLSIKETGMLDTSSNYPGERYISINKAGTYYIKAYGVKDGCYDSDPTASMSLEIGTCPSPTISVTGSNSSTTRTITIAKGSTSDTVYYTIDGTQPNSSSTKTKYTKAFSVNSPTVLKVIEVRSGYVSSPVTTKEIYIGGEKPAVTVATPQHKLDATSSTGAKTLSISCETEGAEIHYALLPYSDENKEYVPTLSDTLYTGPFTINTTGNYYLLSRAYLDGEGSGLARSQIEVTITGVTELDPPVASVKEGHVQSIGTKGVTLTALEGSKIYYYVVDHQITDEEAKELPEIPTDSDHLYTYPVTAVQDCTIVCKAVYTNTDGSVVESIRKGYKIGVTGGPLTPPKVSEVTINTESSGSGINIYIACPDSEADIFYVFDDNPSTVATTGDSAYVKGSPIAVISDGYLHTVAAKPGCEFTTQTFTVSANRTATPTVEINHFSGTTYAAMFSCETPDAVFYWTTDGSDPTTSSSSGSMAPVTFGQTLKVMAVAPGYGPSEIVAKVVGATGDEQCEAVRSSVLSVMGGKLVMLSSATESSQIYYTTDGTDPAVSGTLYDESGIMLEKAGTFQIKAVAKRDGYKDSDLLTIEVSLEALPTPKVGINQYDYYYRAMISFSSDTQLPESYSLYYEMDGVQTTYTGEFSIEKSCLFSAVIMSPGYASGKFGPRLIELPGDDVVRTAMGVKLSDDELYIDGGKLFELTCGTEDAQIYYAFGKGVKPYILYTGPIHITDSVTVVNTVAKKEGMTDSGQVPFTVKNVYTAASPSASVPTNSAVPSGTRIELITDEFYNAAIKENSYGYIHYTLDGTQPTLDSPVYTESIEITDDTLIRAAASDIGYMLSDTVDLYYTVEGQEKAITIDTSGLTRSNDVVSGTVKADIGGIDVTDGKAVAALYSGDELLQAKTADLSESVSFDFEVITYDSIIVKVFVFENLESLAPICENSIMVFPAAQ